MLEKVNTWIVNVTLLAFPSLTLFVKPAASQILGLSALWAVILLLTTAPVRNISPSEKLISRVFLIFILVAIASFVLKGVNYQGFKELGRYARFLAYLPLLIVFSRSRISVVFLIGGMALGAFLSGSWALYAKYYLGHYRVDGDVNTILYGNFSLVYSAAVLFFAVYLSFYKKYLLALFLTVISLLGLFGVAMSGARGGLIALPVVFVAVAVSLAILKAPPLHKKVFWLVIMAFFFTGSVLFIMNNDMLNNRFSTAVEEVGNYEPGKYQTSVGYRFDMWIMSLKAWLDNPILGIGQGHYLDYAKQETSINGGYHSYLIRQEFTQSHNEYLFVAASRGFLGIASLLMVFLFPLSLFLMNIYRRVKIKYCEVRSGAIVGATVISMYMMFCLTESMFARSQAVSIYVFYVAVCSFFAFSGYRKI